jgi:ATP-binding cassette subfamily C protein LapB
VSTASVGKIVPDNAASPQRTDEPLPHGQAPMTRRAPPPPGEQLTPGTAPAPQAAQPQPVPAREPGDSRRVAPPSRPLIAPARAIQFPARAEEAAPYQEAARGPRLDSNVTPLRPPPSSANPFPVPPVTAQPAAHHQPQPQPAAPIHVPPSRAQAAQAAPAQPPRHAAPPAPAQPAAQPSAPPFPPRPGAAIPPPPIVERDARQGDPIAAAVAAANWRLPQQTGRADDPLLDCLIVLTAIFERPHSAEALTAGLPLIQNRITPELFIRAASRAGLAARIVKRPLGEISDLSLPCVLLLKDARACVLTALGGGKATIIVPETGHGTLDIAADELALRYTGYALFARPEYQFDARSEATEIRPTRNWFWGTLGRFWRIYTQVGLAAIFVNLFAIALPLFTMNVYDRVVPTKGQETLWVLVLGVGVIFAFEFLLRLLRSYFVDTAGRSADVIMASTVFQQVLGIRLDSRPPSAGAFAQQLREFETLRDFFTSATLVTLIDLPFVLLFIAVVAIIGGPVALVPLVAVPLIIGCGWFLQVPLNKIVTQTARESAQKHAMLVESIVGLETIKGLGAEGRTQRNWERFVGMTSKSAQRARELSQFGQYFTSLVSQIVSVAVVVVGVYLIFAGDLTVGALIACTILTGRAMAPLTQVAALLTRFDQSMVSLNTIDKIMQMPVERPAGMQFVHRPILRGAVEFRDITFAYPNQPIQALDGVSFAIRPGERVAIIGKIGSGKSTIEKLILGFYQAQKGAIRVDGTDIKQIDPADLRRNIGYVPQDVFLFYGSVRENIAMGAPHADDAAILRAARIAGVDSFVSRHPQGFDLQVGERGEALSGGQRQSIAIARALVRDPNIVILDEPTSAMDKGSEDWLIARLREILEGKTLVLVTQRLSLLTLVERVIVMDTGKIVADGPRDKVLETLAKGQIRGAG